MILVWWKFYVSQTSLVLERLSIAQALQRSLDLTRGSLLRWLGVMVTLLVITMPLTGMSDLATHPMYRPYFLKFVPLDEVAFDVVWVFVSSIFMGVATAFSAIVTTVFYLDCRVRFDGRDLDLRLDALEREHPPAAGAVS